MNHPSHAAMRREIVLRARRLRTQFPDAPLDYFAHSLAYELDMKPEHILRVLEEEWSDEGDS